MEHNTFSTATISLLALCAVVMLFIFPSKVSAVIRLGSPNTTTLSNGLLGYWPLDGSVTNWATGTTRDLSGRGNMGQIAGMSTSSSPVSGKIGQAFQFNGNAYGSNPSYVQFLTTGSTINFGNDSFTFSAWIYTTRSTLESVYQSSTNSNTHWEIILNSFANRLTFAQLNRPGTSDYTLNSSLPATILPNQWHFISATFASSTNTLTIYVDGQQSNQSNPYPTTIIQTGPAPASLGSDFGQGDQPPFKGNIDDVRIYNRALSDAEIKQLYTLGSAKAGHSASDSTIGLNKDLVGYWTFDGPDSQTTAKDRSGNGNNGTINGGVTRTIGKIGQAFNFSNSTYVQLASSTATTMNTNMTMSTWVYSMDNGCCHGVIQRNSAFSNNALYSMVIGYTSLSNSYFECYIGDGTTTVFPNVGIGTRWGLNQWHHLACTTDTSRIYFYFDGQFMGSADRSSIPSKSFGDSWFAIGSANTNQGYFNGKIDDVRIYNRVLTSAEIKQLAAMGTGNVGHSNVGNANGLVSYWTFDGPRLLKNVADSSGRGYTGYLNSGFSTTSVVGKIGQALTFNGTSNQVNISPNAATGGDLGTNITIAAWIKPDNVSGEHTIYDFGSGSAYWVAQTNNTLQWRDSNSGGNGITANLNSSGVVTANVWQHVAFVGTATSLKIYRNGALVGSSNAGVITETSQGNRIGSTGSRYFSGAMDDVRIYNRALSDAEIQQLYNSGK